MVEIRDLIDFKMTIEASHSGEVMRRKIQRIRFSPPQDPKVLMSAYGYYGKQQALQ